MNKQTETLQNSAKIRTKKMIERVKITIEELQKNNFPINFQKVAKDASVSKVWLYQQNELRSLIESVRSNRRSLNSINDEVLVASYKGKIRTLEEKIIQLKKTIAVQELKIEVAYGKMIKL